jgi:hypothetical protein
MHYQRHSTSQSCSVSFLRRPDAGNRGQWVVAHRRLNQRARDMPKGRDVAYDNNLGRRECRGDHVHASAESGTHSIDRMHRRWIATAS